MNEQTRWLDRMNKYENTNPTKRSKTHTHTHTICPQNVWRCIIKSKETGYKPKNATIHLLLPIWTSKLPSTSSYSLHIMYYIEMVSCFTINDHYRCIYTLFVRGRCIVACRHHIVIGWTKVEIILGPVFSFCYSLLSCSRSLMAFLYGFNGKPNNNKDRE